MKSSRPLRVGEILRHALAGLFLRASFYEPPLKDVTLTVTRVEVSSDLRIATVFVVPFGGQNMDEVCVGLKKFGAFFPFPTESSGSSTLYSLSSLQGRSLVRSRSSDRRNAETHPSQ